MATSDQPHRKRCKRYDVPGNAHYLTFSCFYSQPFLSRERCCKWLLDAIVAAKKTNPSHLWAWVIMPEHSHLLIQPTSGSTISKILQSIKQPVSQMAVSWVMGHARSYLPRMTDIQPNGQVTYRFWQRGGGYDRNIWSLQEILEKVQYIHNNPLRRRLVSKPEDWPWSSWRAWTLGVDEPIPIDKESLPWAGKGSASKDRP